jgi:type IV pilus assembly protein PilM
LSREALQQFLSRNTVKGDRVVIGVPGQSGLARFIKLPPVEPSRIPEIVKYEARQQIPFALEEVVWDFQTIGHGEESGGFALETEIGLFAMKRDLIFRFMNPFREAGVEVEVVQMRPLAVYNFAAFDQLGAEPTEPAQSEREELAEKTAPALDGFAVLLDMGADNSDLVITDGTRIWQRNLPIGGNHFTRALTKELKLTFAKAEHLKRNATKAQDPRAIFQAMRPIFNDLVSEIQRSIGYFSSVHRQSKITRIIGMGNAFKLPGLQKFLAQNLQYEVEKVENFRNLKGDQVLSAPAFQENVLTFTVVYGLALQGLGVSGVRTSLLPPEIAQARMIRRKKPWALTAAAILMAGFTSLFFGNWAQLHAVNSEEFKAPEAKAKSAQELKQKKEGEFTKVKGEWTAKKTEGETLTSNVEKRLEWMELLSLISKALPNNPANVDRKDLASLGEVQITSVGVSYFDELKTEWFDKAMNSPWAKFTVLPLDEKEPPTGDGWVFTLEGYHFNKGTRNYTTAALLDTPNGFQQNPILREAGIRAAILLDNTLTQNWIPGSSVARRARTRTTGGGGASGAGPASGAIRGNAPAGMSTGTVTMGGTGMGGSGEGEEEAGSGGRRDSGGESPVTFAPIGMARTDFVLEFAWKPTEKAKRKAASLWMEDIKKYGPRQGSPPPEEKAPAQEVPAGGANTQPGNTQPGTAPNQQPAAGVPATAAPPPNTVPNGTPPPPGR